MKVLITLVFLIKTTLIYSQLTEQLTPKQIQKIKIIKAISRVESEHNPNYINRKEKAIGLLQIRPIMLKEIERITCRKYTIKDCMNTYKSVEIFCLFQERYNPKWNAEIAARIWNGGQEGMNKEGTKEYWNKVKMYL